MSRSASALAVLLGVFALVSGAGAATDGAGPPAGSQLAALAQPPAYSSLASQRIYFVLTDRYANGDPANDKGGVAGTNTRLTGYDPSSAGYFHGGDFKGLTGGCTTGNGVARIKALGFTAIWVTPPVRNQVFQGSSAGYHGYWGLDFTHVDPHLGTDADFAAFVDCAHASGLKVYLDVVVNHTGDTIQVGTSTFIPPSQVPYKDCKGRKFNPARYVTRKFPCLDAAHMPGNPYVLPTQRHTKQPDWLNDVTNYHDRGDIDFGSCDEVCYEQGDFFGLDDLFTEKPNVMNGLAQVYGAWVRRYKLDGFRVDTARHVNAAFFRLWVPKIRAAARSVGVTDFPIFGEIFSTDDQYVSAYVRDRGLPEALDFPFQDVAAGFAASQVNARALRDRLDDDDYFRTPAGLAPTPPTFLGNHDMGRAAYEVESHGGRDNVLERVLLGYDLLYLLRGAPTVYYGDEVGMVGQGGDQQARQDMFPTQVDEWRTQPRVGSPPIGNGSSFDVAGHPVATRLRELAALRDAHPGLSTGASIVRYASGKVFVVSRIEGKRELLVAFNSGTTAARLTVPTSSVGGWHGVWGTAPPLVSVSRNVTLDVPPLSSLVYAADQDIAVDAPTAPGLKVGADDLSNLWAVTATVRDAAPVSVGFGIKRAKGGWTRLALDDTPPYRAFVDPAKYRKREKIQLVAVVRALDGRTAVSRVVPFTVRAT